MSEQGSEVTAPQGDVWFVYDGDCPICATAAHALQIKRTVGALHLVDARAAKDDPILKDISARQLDLDAGAVLKFQGEYYHGDDAMHMMALLGSGHGWFNRMNALLFRSKRVARIAYPVLRGVRNLLIRLRGVQGLNNLALDPDRPIFASVFGADWERLPQVFKTQYSVRPYSADQVRIEGLLDVAIASHVSLMARLSGSLVPWSGEQVPVTVTFRSDEYGSFYFDRTFRFPGRGEKRFVSRMELQRGNELLEFMAFGFAWRLTISWDEARQKVIYSHRGYAWRILGLTIPLPMGLGLGRGDGEETPLSDTRFAMWTHTLHPWFGKTLAYSGEFEIDSSER